MPTSPSESPRRQNGDDARSRASSRSVSPDADRRKSPSRRSRRRSRSRSRSRSPSRDRRRVRDRRSSRRSSRRSRSRRRSPSSRSRSPSRSSSRGRRSRRSRSRSRRSRSRDRSRSRRGRRRSSRRRSPSASPRRRRRSPPSRRWRSHSRSPAAPPGPQFARGPRLPRDDARAPEVGSIHKGRVVRIESFGAFIEVRACDAAGAGAPPAYPCRPRPPQLEGYSRHGLCHISQLTEGRVRGPQAWGKPRPLAHLSRRRWSPSRLFWTQGRPCGSKWSAWRTTTRAGSALALP